MLSIARYRHPASSFIFQGKSLSLSELSPDSNSLCILSYRIPHKPVSLKDIYRTALKQRRGSCEGCDRLLVQRWSQPGGHAATDLYAWQFMALFCHSTESLASFGRNCRQGWGVSVYFVTGMYHAPPNFFSYQRFSHRLPPPPLFFFNMPCSSESISMGTM